MTLNARLHAKRQAAGHSIHDMKLAASLKCDCRECGLARMTVLQAVPATEAEALAEGVEVPF